MKTESNEREMTASEEEWDSCNDDANGMSAVEDAEEATQHHDDEADRVSYISYSNYYKIS